MDGTVFTAYPDQVLNPTRRPGNAAVPDNPAIHKLGGLAEVVKNHGTQLLYLPPYSPDFNPIKLAFSKRRTGLRTAEARTRDVLAKAIRMVAEWISTQDAKKLT